MLKGPERYLALNVLTSCLLLIQHKTTIFPTFLSEFARMAAHGAGEAIQSDSRLKSKKPPSLVIAIPPPEQMMPQVSSLYPANSHQNQP